MEEGSRVNGPEKRGSDCGHIALLEKTKEFFQICDVEGKGFITRTNMRRLHRELPLSAKELEDVFDSLDVGSKGYLTLEAFSSGFSQFLHGRRISVVDAKEVKAKEALYQSQWEAKLAGGQDEEENYFCMLLESLGASSVFEDPDEVRSLWVQLRKDEPHLLSNFEEFLARVTLQIKEAHQEKNEMESALQRKAATHDSEIQRLYEEMEAQIMNEKDRLNLKDSERLQSRSQDLQQQLSSKERELDQIFQKQRRLERQCRELSSEQHESRVENVKLKMTNEELSRELGATCQELAQAQEHLALLQEQAALLQQDKEMEMYRVTEGLQREKQSLMKQLDLLREMNKHLKDERDICSGTPRTSLRKKQKQRAGLGSLFDDDDGDSQAAKSEDDSVANTTSAPAWRPATRKTPGAANGYVNSTQGRAQDGRGNVRKVPGRTASAKKVFGREKERQRRREKELETDRKAEAEEEVLDTPLDGWPLRRVISIEEDHLPHLLHGDPQPLLHQLSEEEEEEDDEEDDEEEEEEEEELQSDVVLTEPAAPGAYVPVPTAGPAVQKSHFGRMKMAPTSPRRQPVGKETQLKVKEGVVSVPDRLFKVVLVGNSSVGKTSLLRSFCEGRFHPSTTATVGIDYSVKTLTLDNTQVAMQLWDTAGQERYRSMTKQFFRKADGVVVMYDVTVAESFRAVRPWLANVKEDAGEGVPVLLIGNKMDMDVTREVSYREAAALAYETKVMFHEVSAYTGNNVTESLTHLARVLKEQEDRVRDTTIILSAQPVKKKACCK